MRFGTYGNGRVVHVLNEHPWNRHPGCAMCKSALTLENVTCDALAFASSGRTPCASCFTDEYVDAYPEASWVVAMYRLRRGGPSVRIDVGPDTEGVLD
jgi:hypothetical protein